jgi:hypothetical protein
VIYSGLIRIRLHLAIHFLLHREDNGLERRTVASRVSHRDPKTVDSPLFEIASVLDRAAPLLGTSLARQWDRSVAPKRTR